MTIWNYFELLKKKKKKMDVNLHKKKTTASVCKTLCPQHLLAPKYSQSKKISNDQRLTQ